MARLNPRRRRLAAQTLLFRSIVSEHGKAHDDSDKLQRGPVRSCLTKSAHVSGKGNVSGIAAKDQVRVSAPRGVSMSPTWFIGKGGKATFQGNKGVLSPRRPKSSDFKG